MWAVSTTIRPVTCPEKGKYDMYKAYRKPPPHHNELPFGDAIQFRKCLNHQHLPRPDNHVQRNIGKINKTSNGCSLGSTDVVPSQSVPIQNNNHLNLPKPCTATHLQL